MDKKQTDTRATGKLPAIMALAAFLASSAFFLTVYPYHLMRREQINLFVYDWDYISRTFRGIGWLSRLAGSFVEQFFCVRVLGAIIVPLLLVAIAAVTYRICRKFLGKPLSYMIAALMYVWFFLRECGNVYLTRYTIAGLGFLSLILLALQFRKVYAAVTATVLLLGFGAWAFGSPYDSIYGKLWGVPRMNYERLFAIDAETARENWDKVLDLSGKDLHMLEAEACRNIALAMEGQLGNKLLDHTQGDPFLFLLSVSGDRNLFTNCIAGEQWYQIGDMTVAEQSAVTALQASPEHTGARFIERLARVNIITGQEATAQKYLILLSKTLFYRKWAVRMLDGGLAGEDREWIGRGRANMADSDLIHLGNDPRTVLQGLLKTNPDNTPAREFLLCYDLLRYDLEQFMEDYDPCRLDARIYKEAAVIWLGQQGVTSKDVLEEYGIDDRIGQRSELFFRYPENYRNTYWYYYLNPKN